MPHLGRLCHRAGEITRGYRLKARHVIHAVGPRWRGGTHGEAALLASCYCESLTLAVASRRALDRVPGDQLRLYGYPIPDAARVAIDTTVDFLKSDDTLTSVVFACFGQDVLRAFQSALPM